MRTRLLVALALTMGVAPGVTLALAGTAADIPATVAESAERDVQWSIDATCDLETARAIGVRHPGTRQVIVLATDSFSSTYGDAFAAVRALDGTWRCQTNTVTGARFGRNGTRPLLDRRSGDGTTPAGVFPLGAATAWDGQVVNVFGNRSDPGVRAGIGYRDVRPEDCWGAIPGDPGYNHLVNNLGCVGPSNEWLQRYGDVYSHAALIGANTDPISGDSPDEADRAYAAAIFLHRHSYRNGLSRPTSGCVSLPYDDLATMIRLLDPTLQPHFAIGPTDWLRADA